MPEFLKPEVPKKFANPTQAHRPPVSEKKVHLKADERLVVRTKMPNTLAYWSDLMLANAAFKSYNDNFRLTCLSAMQQRAKHDMPRQPKKAHWDYLLDEAEWLRRDFREERVSKMSEAKKRAGECLQAWTLRVEERGRFTEDGEGTGLGLGYRREGDRNGDVCWEGDVAMRARDAGEDAGGDVLGKRKRKTASEGGEDIQDRVQRPRTLRRFSCHVDDSI